MQAHRSCNRAPSILGSVILSGFGWTVTISTENCQVHPTCFLPLFFLQGDFRKEEENMCAAAAEGPQGVTGAIGPTGVCTGGCTGPQYGLYLGKKQKSRLRKREYKTRPRKLLVAVKRRSRLQQK